MDTLKSIIKGKILTINEKEEYEKSLLNRWNIDVLNNNTKPRLIVFPENNQDIVNSILYAKNNNLEFAIKAGGHGFNSKTNDGLLLDLCNLKKVKIDIENEIIKVQGGCLLIDMDKECEKHNFLVPSGTYSETGVAGLTLGGGLGYFTRKYGLTSDHLLQVELITCDGEIKIINKDTDNDLLWALKSIGTNFGVITEFTFKLNKLPPSLYLGTFIIDNTDDEIKTSSLMKFCYFLENEKDSNLGYTKDLSFIISISNKQTLILALYTGSNNDSEEDKSKSSIIDFLSNSVLSEIKNKKIETIGLTKLQSQYDHFFPPCKRYYKRGIFIKENLNFQLLNNLINSIKSHPQPEGVSFTIIQLGGEFNNLEFKSNSSFPYRDSSFQITTLSCFTIDDNDNDNDNTQDNSKRNEIYNWTNKIYDLYLNQYRIGDYSNTNDAILDIENFLGKENLLKLKSIKLKHDPTNFFKNNFNLINHKKN